MTVLRVAEHWSGTDTGRQRRANEDSLLVRSPLFVVADGMGGAQAGEVASHMAVESFKHGLSSRADPLQGLASLITQANARINERSRHDVRQAGMGTTVTAVYVGAHDIAIAHVGDSRAYCLRDGELIRLTDDHSLVDELIRQGRLTPQEAEDHPQRSVITRALGPEDHVEVDTRSFPARPGDVYLLCSDGLTTMVPEEELVQLLHAHDRLRDAGRALIEAANRAGGKDNITVVLARLEEAPSVDVHAPDGGGLTTIAGDVPATIAGAGPGATTDDVPTTIAGAGPGATTGDGLPTVTDAHVVPDATGPPANADAHVVPARPPARRPRRPSPQAQARKRPVRALRLVRVLLPLLVVLGLLATGAYLAIESVYFIGTNSRGLVTIYRGVPFQLPGGLSLYSRDYISGVSASTLSPARRHTLLDHSLRSEKNAAELVRQLELGELSER